MEQLANSIKRGLRREFVYPIFALAFLGIGLKLWVSWVDLRALKISQLQTRSESLSYAMSVALEEAEASQYKKIMSAVGASRDLVFLELRPTSGRLFDNLIIERERYKNSRNLKTNAVLDRLATEAREDQKFSQALFDEVGMFFSAVPLLLKPSSADEVRYDSAVLILGFDVDSVQERVDSVWRNDFLAGIFILIFIIGFVFAFIQKKIISQLYQSRAMLSESARLVALGEMAGGIAHEVNNPLSIVLGRINVLKRKISKIHSEGKTLIDQVGLNSDLEVIERAAERISKIVKGMRSLARHDPTSDFSLVNLKQPLEDALGLVAEKFKNHGIDIRQECIEAYVNCRPVQISQVILNLLNNSHFAIQNQDEKWIKVSIIESDTNVILSVVDSGPRIDGIVADKMFQPFYTNKPVGSGTGLGLSISYNIMVQHNGELRYQRYEPNTTFQMIFPKPSTLSKATT